MQQAGHNAYKTMQKEGLTGRALEAHVLTRAAAMLKDCQLQWGDEGHAERLDAAIRFNQKVWTLFQTELVAPENPIPKELKENLLSLSLFMDGRLFDVLAKQEPELLTAVININQNIAAGLMEKPKDENADTTVREVGTLAVSA